MFLKLRNAEGRPLATSLPSPAYTFEPARSPRALADSCVFCASAGLDTLGATAVTGPVGARGAGANRSHCRRCARVARGRSSRLAPRCALASSPSLWRPVAAGHDGRLLRARTSVVCVAGCGCFDFVDFVDLAAGAWSPGVTVAASAASAARETMRPRRDCVRARCGDVSKVRVFRRAPHPVSARVPRVH